MDIVSKYKIVEKIVKSDNDLILKEIEALLNLSSNDFWNAIPDNLREDIEVAKREMDKGEGIPHDEVIDDVKKRFLKS